MIDRGANGCIAGDDVRVIDWIEHRRVNVEGVNHHELLDLRMANVGGVATSSTGEFIAIIHQTAHCPTMGSSILSAGQIESFGITVDDKSVRVGGGQHIKTVGGRIMPLSIRHGLPYLKMRPYTDQEWNTLPHVVLTADVDWDPSVLDFDHPELDTSELLDGNGITQYQSLLGQLQWTDSLGRSDISTSVMSMFNW